MNIYKNVIEEKANTLLFTEDSMNFYQYNLKIWPVMLLNLAAIYIMQLVNKLLANVS
jgi:hypothetical protein